MQIYAVVTIDIEINVAKGIVRDGSVKKANVFFIVIFLEFV